MRVLLTEFLCISGLKYDANVFLSRASIRVVYRHHSVCMCFVSGGT